MEDKNNKGETCRHFATNLFYKKVSKMNIIQEIPVESECSLSDDSEGDEDFTATTSHSTVIPEVSSSSEEESESTENGDKSETPVPNIMKCGSTVKNTTKTTYTWTKKEDAHESVPPFTGTDTLHIEGEDPVDFFLSLFSEELLEHIVFQTNLYATQNGKETFRIILAELKKFLGINLIMSYIKYPRIRQYWSSEDGLRMHLIANAMPVNRFEAVMRYLHFSDNTDHDANNRDRLYKIRPVLDHIKKTFLKAADPEEHQSIDEQIIPFKGHSSLKQYLPKKPKCWGLKVWVRAGSSGYVYRFEVYQGASGGRENVSNFGACADVVLCLCDDIHNKGHKVFFDTLFTSVSLLEELKRHGINATGTCRANRLKGAQEHLPTEKELKKQGRGVSTSVTNENNVTITRWLDNSAIQIATTCAGKYPEDIVECWSRNEKKIITLQRPFAVAYYNTHMGGVDLMDQGIALYPHRCHNKRWYLRVFFHFLDVSVVNAWFLHRKASGTLPLLDFKASIARALINIGNQDQLASKRGRPSSTTIPPPTKRRAVSKAPPEIRYHEGQHWPKLTDIKNANRCHDKNCSRKMKYTCMKCKEPLCPDCFANFHSKD